MEQLSNGLYDAGNYEDSLSIDEARLSMLKRLGASERDLLIKQTNLACTYARLHRLDEALSLRRDVYFGTLRLYGEEHRDTFVDAYNYANSLVSLQHNAEAKALVLKTLPVARRVLGDNDRDTLKLRWIYAEALYTDPAATLDDLRLAVKAFEKTEQVARRVLGGGHPDVADIEGHLRKSRAALRAHETPSGSAP